jgi:hypothetical protein
MTSPLEDGMFALLAVICFAVEFVLDLVGSTTGKINLIALGLAFVAAHFLVGAWPAFPRLGRRE